MLTAISRSVVVVLRVLVAALGHLLEVARGKGPRFLSPRAPSGGPLRLRRLLTSLGGAFVKLGQFLAMQPHLVGDRYARALYDLMDRLEPMPLAAVDAVVEEELGAPLRSLFDELDPRPLSTASIGQVHVARIGARRVAVKVQRPGAAAAFRADLAMLQATIRIVHALRWRRFAWIEAPISEFVAWTRQELDYRHEARFMERVRRNAADRPGEVVPGIVPELTSPRVLTSDLLPGRSVLDLLRSDPLDGGDGGGDPDFDPDLFSYHVVDNLLFGAFRHGIFHADLHPANLLVQPGGAVGYVDFGITGLLGWRSRLDLASLTLAWARADVGGMFAAFSSLADVPSRNAARAYRRGLESLSRGWYEDGPGSPRLTASFARVVVEMLDLSHRTGLMPGADVTRFLRSAVAADALIDRLAPGIALGPKLEESAGRHVRALLQDRAFSHERLAELADRMGGWIGAAERELPEPPDATDDRSSGSTAGLRRAAAVLALLLLAAGPSGAAPSPDALLVVELVLITVGSILLGRTLWLNR